jgi:hypothetical protein
VTVLACGFRIRNRHHPREHAPRRPAVRLPTETSHIDRTS